MWIVTHWAQSSPINQWLCNKGTQLHTADSQFKHSFLHYPRGDVDNLDAMTLILRKIYLFVTLSFISSTKGRNKWMNCSVYRVCLRDKCPLLSCTVTLQFITCMTYSNIMILIILHLMKGRWLTFLGTAWIAPTHPAPPIPCGTQQYID